MERRRRWSRGRTPLLRATMLESAAPHCLLRRVSAVQMLPHAEGTCCAVASLRLALLSVLHVNETSCASNVLSSNIDRSKTRHLLK